MSASVHVEVEIERAAGTVRGEVAAEGAPGGRFFGWLELIALLERAAGAAETTPEVAERC
jgi:hypothetical protein